MSTSNISNRGQPKKVKVLPLWQAYLLAFFVWGVLPWAVSLLMPRYGWTAGGPSLWNLLGLVPVLIGATGLIWGMALHAAGSAQGIEWELDRSYLLKGSLYNFSRNPMYVSELILMAGWFIFYGSVSVLVALLVWWVSFNYYQIPLEERVLEAHFGDSYREYKSRVRRWF